MIRLAGCARLERFVGFGFAEKSWEGGIVSLRLWNYCFFVVSEIGVRVLGSRIPEY